MKSTLIFIISTLLFVSTIFLPTTFAQDYTTWNLPEGATARLGKGSIREIVYSPDGRLLAVASVSGSTIRPPIGELPCSPGIRVGSRAYLSVPMVAPLPVGVWTAPFAYGMLKRVKI